MVNVNVKVAALEKLVDYTASGIGTVAGPMLAPWKARKEQAAKAGRYFIVGVHQGCPRPCEFRDNLRQRVAGQLVELAAFVARPVGTCRLSCRRRRSMLHVAGSPSQLRADIPAGPR